MSDSPAALARAVIDALALPPEARVDQRVPKKLFLEHGAPTAADRKRIQTRLGEVTWVAALKPGTIAVPAYRDAEREYLEVAVLNVRTQGAEDDARLPELVHRAIPYPLLLLSEGDATLTLSLAHKRWSRGEGERVVLDGALLVAVLHFPPHAIESDFVSSLAPAGERPRDLWELYDGWMARVQALSAARITQRYVVATTAARVSERREALARYDETVRELAALRLAAEREKQITKRVELNLELRRLEQERAELLERL